MFHGSIVALVTPMLANGDIDYVSLRKLVDWQIENGTDGIVVTGTTGEAPTLDTEEQLGVITAVVEQAAGRVPVIAGTGTNSTAKTIHMTQKAMECGADACLLVTPYYNKPTQEGLYQHYAAIAKAVPIPQILYNVPGRTGCELLPQTVARLASIANIVGIKEGRLNVAVEILKLCGKQLDVFSGDDVSALDIILQGGRGVVSVGANVVPKLMHDMCTLALAGNNEAAEKINQQLTPLYTQLFVESNPIPVKWAMYHLGLIPEGIRLPLTALAKQYREEVESALKAIC